MRNRVSTEYRVVYRMGKLAFLLAGLFLEVGYMQSQSSSLRKPIISHIDIMGEAVTFSRLQDIEYRNTLSFGNQLVGAFDSLQQFTDCPNRLQLPHDLNTVTLHYSHPNWKASHDVVYSHMIDGKDFEWSIPTKDPFVELVGLKPGFYDVQIKARSRSGSWSGIASYNLIIKHPWWESWWALALAVAGSVALIAVAAMYWHKRQIEIQEMQSLLEAYKKAALPTFKIRSHREAGDGFLRLVNHTLEAHVSDENFGIAELCELLNISRAQLHRKLKSLTGLSTSHYIRSLRLELARSMFHDASLNISEVAFAVGFSNASYFSRVYKSHFGISPKESRDNIQNA